jgi:hypothetical protein
MFYMHNMLYFSSIFIINDHRRRHPRHCASQIEHTHTCAGFISGSTCLITSISRALCAFFHVRRVPHYVVDHDRFRENYFIAASMAAPDGDLLPFFTERLKWNISPDAIQYLRTKHNLPRRGRKRTQNKGAP